MENRDVAVSTRARLARNMEKLPFPHRLRGTARADAVYRAARAAFAKAGSDLRCAMMCELPRVERLRMAERRLISRELADAADGGCIYSEDGAVSVMLMEEDHFRLQAFRKGLDTAGAMLAVQELERMLAEHAAFARSPRLGYLTACPTNVGTGLRVSVMLHLPALSMMGAIDPMLNDLGKAGFTARGLYGEGTKAYGQLYQISNQATLGLRPGRIAEAVQSAGTLLIQREREARAALAKSAETEDKIMRAWGTLLYAVSMDTQEALGLLSLANMGIGLGFIEGAKNDTIYSLMTEVMPGMLAREDMEAAERDRLRCRIIQRELGGKKT